ncbi:MULTISPECIES: YhdH/YhfP family quinone oxidoreductase [unclassified Fusibacter]|uniref:YhdH/YhfP family quinone oxidoreductase n=1 Tax=unclassified Fusibacter TaxID=2624464 RepID=UPI001012D1AC|nr:MULTISPECIES: YhdH/YhfP family quinone oxidoreductase [unclassified Fusibacter]MCK8058495.1 YhdH/YhfP family quinone oxidoreductase [Fusibacter sp. A2]NPE22736.1 YhdH/YhfP family quinone oxidoreductase [Fusibacter sp. A1]RXV60295.1 oxidoreductase [Fusibacter sp. A1]
MEEFKAMVVKELEGGTFHREITHKSLTDLPSGDVLIKVDYSSLNYKDALSATGNKGVTRSYPHTPGIDAAGLVEESTDTTFTRGDSVIVTGYDLGMNTDGGFAEYIRVPASWVVKLPEGLSLKESMIYGTAGFTAALSVYRLINSGVKPTDGEILVTGATGGVGSTAITILQKLGYTVIASTGKPQEKELLLNLGASDIIDRHLLDDKSGKPLLKSRWAGVIDTVGGNTLATALKTTNYGGCVTCCGNVASHEFQTSVFPFILKGISLIGIDSVNCPMEHRLEVWNLLAGKWKAEDLTKHIHEITLEELDPTIDLMLKGQHKGRSIVKL